VYWVAPSSGDLGPQLDDWLRSHRSDVQATQSRWFGATQRLDENTHLADLLARRLAFMPIASALKKAQGLPIEDLPREQEVLLAVARGAEARSLPAKPVHDLFVLQLDLAKAVQRRQQEPSALDLAGQVRPALSAVGERILDALVEARATQRLASLALIDLEPLSPWLTDQEREQLLSSLLAVANG
jgi:chorismate mutase